jgi:hypothetical protein
MLSEQVKWILSMAQYNPLDSNPKSTEVSAHYSPPNDNNDAWLDGALNLFKQKNTEPYDAGQQAFNDSYFDRASDAFEEWKTTQDLTDSSPEDIAAYKQQFNAGWYKQKQENNIINSLEDEDYEDEDYEDEDDSNDLFFKEGLISKANIELLTLTRKEAEAKIPYVQEAIKVFTDAALPIPNSLENKLATLRKIAKSGFKPADKKLWAKCKAEIKKKYDVYPSAYANLALSKLYKKRGGAWKKEAAVADLGSSIETRKSVKQFRDYIDNLPRPDFAGWKTKVAVPSLDKVINKQYVSDEDEQWSVMELEQVYKTTSSNVERLKRIFKLHRDNKIQD